MSGIKTQPLSFHFQQAEKWQAASIPRFSERGKGQVQSRCEHGGDGKEEQEQGAGKSIAAYRGELVLLV
jgi:hypothetical protein